ncbi:MAG: AI-2E family transporter [Planctomycetota bacterium]
MLGVVRKDAIQPAPPPGRARDLLIMAACVCVIAASLRAAAAFFIPVSVALLVSLTCIPAVRRLERHGVPSGLAVLFVLLVVIAAVLAVPLVIGASVSHFRSALPDYQAKIGPLYADVTAWLRGLGWDVPDEPQVSQWYDTGAFLQFVADTTGGLVKALSNVVVVLLVMIFTLLESRRLPGKLERAFGGPAAAAAFEQVIQRTGSYISAKASMSVLTGCMVGLLNAVAGVDFALLWGFVAFAFNFVPNIGSIVAALPAILLAGVDLGVGPAAGVAVGYLVINVSISNGLEPYMMGTRLGLSTLVVFLSVVFWFWMWGPVGMLLSVPLTMVMKIVLEQSDESRPFALLLGRGG